MEFSTDFLFRCHIFEFQMNSVAVAATTTKKRNRRFENFYCCSFFFKTFEFLDKPYWQKREPILCEYTHTNALPPPNWSSDFVNNVTLCQMENIRILKMDLLCLI